VFPNCSNQLSRNYPNHRADPTHACRLNVHACSLVIYSNVIRNMFEPFAVLLLCSNTIMMTLQDSRKRKKRKQQMGDNECVGFAKAKVSFCTLQLTSRSRWDPLLIRGTLRSFAKILLNFHPLSRRECCRCTSSFSNGRANTAIAAIALEYAAEIFASEWREL